MGANTVASFLLGVCFTVGLWTIDIGINHKPPPFWGGQPSIYYYTVEPTYLDNSGSNGIISNPNISGGYAGGTSGSTPCFSGLYDDRKKGK